ncbi:MAG: tRNA-dihydrouridine synthase family protein [Oscillospiraceae bacterium]|nr:tRNA-dihydrouridine synthase family protein [Oscillospiraceae bacterium]
MRYICAPMQGVTGHVWRRVLTRHFDAPDAWYTPFLSPTQDRVFTPRELREVEAQADKGVIPQLIGHNPEDMLWAIRSLADMGYTEVNLNLGCPSGTMVSKKKGAGLLNQPDLLNALLDGVFAGSPIAISLKTRLGMESPEEFPALLELYNQYPASLLILHPRVRRQQYKGLPDAELWAYAKANSRLPLCYNGNLFDRESVSAFASANPDTDMVMLGRGAAANPKLFAELKGSTPLTKEELLPFLDSLWEAYISLLGQERQVLMRMKEHWAYLGQAFSDNRRPLKKLMKASDAVGYRAALAELMDSCPLRNPAGYLPPEEL